MTTRTFKQLGIAYGSTTASIDVTIDGNSVYSGTVTTENTPFPSLPNPGTDYGSDIYTWTGNVDFTGGQTLSISVTGSPVLLTNSVANYIPVTDPVSGNIVSGGADVYGPFATEVIDGVAYVTTLQNVAIDGVPQDQTPDPTYPGQRYWIVPEGSTFTATYNIIAGL